MSYICQHSPGNLECMKRCHRMGDPFADLKAEWKKEKAAKKAVEAEKEAAERKEAAARKEAVAEKKNAAEVPTLVTRNPNKDVEHGPDEAEVPAVTTPDEDMDIDDGGPTAVAIAGTTTMDPVDLASASGTGSESDQETHQLSSHAEGTSQDSQETNGTSLDEDEASDAGSDNSEAMDIGSGDDSEENTDDGDLYCGFAPEVKERVKEYLRAEAYIATVLSHDSEHQNASLTLQKQFTDLETELKERIERSERDKRIINDKFNQQIRDIEAKRGRALEAEHESFIPELEYLQQVIEDRGFKIGRQQNVLKRVQTERVKGKENKRAMRLAGGFELGLAVAETRKRTEQMGRGSF